MSFFFQGRPKNSDGNPRSRMRVLNWPASARRHARRITRTNDMSNYIYTHYHPSLCTDVFFTHT